MLLSVPFLLQAQRRSTRGFTTGSSDVVFAISFSPDGKTLAIARGAGEPTQRFGRIELWDTAAGTLRHIIQGFDGPVRSISFSPNGTTLISASLEYHATKLQQKALSRSGDVFGELKWWDPQTGVLKNKVIMPGEDSMSIDVRYSPDGKQLSLVQSFRRYFYLGAASIFDPTNSSLPGRTLAQRSFFPTFTFSADLKVLDAQTGEQKIKIGLSRASNAIFSPDGRLMAVTANNEIKLYNTTTGKEDHKLRGLKGTVTGVSFSPDGRTLAVVDTKFGREDAGRFIRVMGRSSVILFNVNDWKVISKLEDLGAVHCLSFEPSGRFLVLGGMLREKGKAVPALKLWDLQTRKVAHFPTGSEDFAEAISSLAIAQDGTFLAFTAGSETVQLLETTTWKVKQKMDSASAGDRVQRPVGRFLLSVKTIVAAAFSPDGSALTAETDQGEIRQWDPRTGEVKHQANGGEDPTFVTASTNGKTFAELLDGELKIWSAANHVKRNVELPSQVSASAVALSSEGDLMAIGSVGDVVLIDVSTGSVKKTMEGRGEHVDCLAFSDDGRTLAVADDDGMVQLWDVASSSVTRTIVPGTGIQALRFAPNGAVLASAEGQTITLYDVASGRLLRKLDKHDAPINALAFSANGQLLASGSDDRTAIIWDVRTGKSKHTLKGHDQTVRTVAFSPDGRLLASGSGNASVVLWDVKSGRFNRVLR